MFDKKFLILLFIILLILGIVLYVILNIQNQKKQQLVYSTSRKLELLKTINSLYKFKHVPNNTTYTDTCNSKKQLENAKLVNFLIEKIKTYPLSCKNLIDDVEYNLIQYNRYLFDYNNIKSFAEQDVTKTTLSLEKYIEIENTLFKKEKLTKPVTDITVTCTLYYSSPQGRNNYEKKHIFNLAQLKTCYAAAIESMQRQNKYEEFKKEERRKMTPSLRYEILKRDGFKCKICGASASDGAKLHVDHIYPISRGGKTEPNNLRTLCEDCNIGKGANIE